MRWLQNVHGFAFSLDILHEITSGIMQIKSA